MILFFLSFIAGVLTILAPCTLPILPVIVGSSVAGAVGGAGAAADAAIKALNRRKALTISVALGVSIILFTFLLKVSSLLIAIPEATWSIVSGVIIIIFGLISLFPTIWERIPFVSRLSIGSNKLLGVGYQKHNFWGDVIIGASLGPVFSTCSPTYFVILATVLPQSFLAGFIDLLAYAVGLSGMVLLVSFAGQKIVDRLGGLSDSHGWFKRTLGLIFVLLGLSIMFGYEKIAERKLLDSGIFDITKVEQSLLQFNDNLNKKSETLSEITDSKDTEPTTEPAVGVSTSTATSTAMNTTSSAKNTTTSATTTASKKTNAVSGKLMLASHGPVAPELVAPNGYINTGGQPITLSQFKGNKVVLLDVWTYSCINCQRTLPYITAWYKKYKDQGLEIIGIHTPEFAFEKVQSNVEDAVKRLGIEYPVILDNNYQTWTAYGNHYWPRKYLINGNGEIIYDHIGEGNYDETEREIQRALLELKTAKGESGASAAIPTDITHPANEIPVDMGSVASPETYFGSARNSFLANGDAGLSGEQVFTLPPESQIALNKLYLSGTWNFSDEYAVSKSASKIVYRYRAKNVYMVASSDTPQKVTILIDGKKTQEITIQKNTLYTLFEGADYSGHLLEIDSDAPGLKAFTFTFG